MEKTYQMPHMGGATISTRLMSRLLAELRSGEFAGSTRLPSEVELAEKFKVSRSVVRDALAGLEREGFIERGRGIGTVIQRDVVSMVNRMDIKYEYNDLVTGMGARPRADKVKLYEEKATEMVAKKLQIEPGTPVVVCKKRILADGKPVIYSIDYLPKALFGQLDYKQLDWGQPIFDILEEKLGIVVDTDMASLLATNATPEVRQLLEIGPDEALLLMDEVGYYKLSRPILHSHGYYTNFFNFSLLRKKF
ncbi:GntR family transcriptional regulator [Ruminococcaceae bacterium OttesenSCG-928-A16]|nr:GntR family transcriptional regulator [Ruminococcaceae bacterium OttesenSCG-928-A16]